MSYVRFELYLHKRLDSYGGDWDSNGVKIENAYNKKLNIKSGSVIDSLSFHIPNVRNQYFSTGTQFENGDKIKVYLKKNAEVDTSTDTPYEFIIKSVKESVNPTKTLIINCKSATETLLKGVTFITSSTDLTPPEILQKALDFHNTHNPNFQITWKSTNPTTKSDGSSFPTYPISVFYQPMYQVFEKYSSNQFTKDGFYYFYINQNKELVWDKKDTTLQSIEINETDCISATVDNNPDDVVNSVVIFCGNDANGVGIRAYAFDMSSRAKNGAVWKFLTSTNTIAKDIMQYEIDTNPTSFDVDSNGWFPTSYPYTTTFGTTVNSDSEYNSAIRNEAKNRGLVEGKAFLEGVSKERIKIQCYMPFNLNFTIMGYYKCNFPSYGLSGKKLRLEEITYTDYNTILTLKEDEMN